MSKYGYAFKYLDNEVNNLIIVKFIDNEDNKNKLSELYPQIIFCGKGYANSLLNLNYPDYENLLFLNNWGELTSLNKIYKNSLTKRNKLFFSYKIV